MSYKRGLAIVFGCAIAGLVAFAATYPRFYSSAAAASAAAAPHGASAGEVLVPLSTLSLDDPLAWSRLSASEHDALSPFAAQWDKFSDERRQKWMKIASRYHKLSPEAQKKLHDRMTEWARMTPDERRVARENYQVSKSVPLEKRESAWDAYQKLPEEQKKKLAATEKPRRPTVVSAPPSGKTEVKDINRLINSREHAKPSEALAAETHATAASSVGGSSAPAAPAFDPAPPIPVSPQQAPSLYHGS